MRDVEVIDAELRLVAALRRAARDRGGPLPSIDVADALLDERHEVTARAIWRCDTAAKAQRHWMCSTGSIRSGRLSVGNCPGMSKAPVRVKSLTGVTIGPMLSPAERDERDRRVLGMFIAGGSERQRS
jgi:hypothetical protein